METDQKKGNKALIVFIVIILIFAALSVAYVVAGLKAINAGANSEQTKDFLIKHLPWEWHEVLSVTPNPKEDQILKQKQPEETPMLFIVYRFECPDCEKAYPYIKEKINQLTDEEKSHIWWVPSRTKYGKLFLEKHPIELVPSSVLRLDDEAQIDILYNPETSQTDKDMIDDVFRRFTEQLRE